MAHRIRNKRNISARLEGCGLLLTDDPALYRGGWRRRLSLPPDAPLYVEIGCGKGGFLLGMAGLYPSFGFVGLERQKNALITGPETALRLGGIANLVYALGDAADMPSFFDGGEIDGIYLNFSDPWPKRKHQKRRLTHEGFLRMYKGVLSPGGGLYLRTDNEGLFDFSLSQLARAGFEPADLTRDLHSRGLPEAQTEYERKFSGQGKKICYFEAKSQ